MNLNLKIVIDYIKGSVVCVLNNERTEYATGEEAMISLN